MTMGKKKSVQTNKIPACIRGNVREYQIGLLLVSNNFILDADGVGESVTRSCMDSSNTDEACVDLDLGDVVSL